MQRRAKVAAALFRTGDAARIRNGGNTAPNTEAGMVGIDQNNVDTATTHSSRKVAAPGGPPSNPLGPSTKGSSYRRERWKTRGMVTSRNHGLARKHRRPQKQRGSHLSFLLLIFLLPTVTSCIIDHNVQVSVPDTHTWLDFKINNYNSQDKVPTHDGEFMKGY